jgi:hypothetical protein
LRCEIGTAHDVICRVSSGFLQSSAYFRPELRGWVTDPDRRCLSSGCDGFTDSSGVEQREQPGDCTPDRFPGNNARRSRVQLSVDISVPGRMVGPNFADDDPDGNPAKPRSSVGLPLPDGVKSCSQARARHAVELHDDNKNIIE